MDRQLRKWMKLRIALSAVSGIVCVLLVGLWLRSYWWHFYVEYRGTEIGIMVQSDFGQLTVDIRLGPFAGKAKWYVISRPLQPVDFVPENERCFEVHRHEFGGYFVAIPYWFPVIIFATLAALPWLPWRFSLRTLLIATTLVAIVLGLVVWAVR
jgi:hypothetical protein